MTDLATAAAGYATRGWPVLPLHSPAPNGCSCHRNCSSPAKHPRTTHGLKEATTDRAVVAAWWARWPDANIGLRTGDVFDVADFDSADALAVFVEEDQDRTDGPTSLTGKGAHVYVAATGLGNRAGFMPGCDWRGRNGYVVAPPSVHPNGRRYQWLDQRGPDHPLLRPPAWLVERVRPMPSPSLQMESLGSPMRRDGGPGRYGQRALEGEVARVCLAPQGQRNDTLNRAAMSLGQLVAAGDLSAEEVAGQLYTAGVRSGLDATEVERTVASGLRAGLRTPRRRP